MRYSLAPVVLLLACNQPPEGGLLAIQPSSPTTTDDLQAVLTEDAVDPNGKDTVSYSYAWTVDGTAVEDIDGDTVPAARTARDQVWAVSVEPTDGKKIGAALTASTTIENTPPTVSGVAISPTSAMTDATLTVSYSTADADDDEVTGMISWTIDGTEVGTGTTLAGSMFDRGDAVSVSVTPDDGTDTGTPMTAGPITILNSPPTAPTATISPAEPRPADDLRCLLASEATDADGDSLTYTASWTVDGEDFAGSTATTTFAGDSIPASATAADQVWTCTIHVDDGDDTNASAPSAAATISAPPGVTFLAGYYWVIADYPAPRSDHSTICADKGLVATATEVTLDWDAEKLETLSADFGYASAGDTDCCATAMWCWDGGGSPLTSATDGTCETHNFGTTYWNYGTYSSSTAERPVFTCTDATEK